MTPTNAAACFKLANSTSSISWPIVLSVLWCRSILLERYICFQTAIERSSTPLCIVHCSDEIYGNSIIDPSARFDSILHILADARKGGNLSSAAPVNDLIHVIFGLSKDFSASGLRMGCLHSKNETLNKALGNLGYFCACSNLTQWMVADVLSDSKWLQHYIEENNRRCVPACAMFYLHDCMSARSAS